jgi:hypothetical protein
MQQFVEARRAQERKAEAFTNSIKKMVKDNHLYAGHGKSEKRVDGEGKVDHMDEDNYNMGICDSKYYYLYEFDNDRIKVQMSLY